MGGWVAIEAIATVVLLFYIFSEERKAKELELKIMFFDKRYKIYEYFMRYFNKFEESIIVSEKTYGIGCSSPYNFATSVLRNTSYASAMSPNTFAGDDSFESQEFEWNLFHKIKNEVALSEFCYPKEISDSILKYSDCCFPILLKYQSREKEYEKLEENFADLRKCHKQIKENDIVGKMKRLLNL